MRRRRDPPVLVARRVVGAPADRVRAFLGELVNHDRLDDRALRLIALDDDGGRIALRGPAGLLRRTAQIRVTSRAVPTALAGEARVGRRTRAHVAWIVEDTAAGGVAVVLCATILDLAVTDRVLLAAGGRWWVRRSFTRVLARLATILDQDAVNPVMSSPVSSGTSSWGQCPTPSSTTQSAWGSHSVR